MKAVIELGNPERSWRFAWASGTSITELVAWFAIFGCVSLIASPSLVRMLDLYDLHGASRRVYAELQGLRSAAVASNTRYKSEIASGQLQFTRFDLESGSWVSSGSAGEELRKVSVAGTGEIVFAPNGTAPNPGSITLTNDAGSHKTVVVSAAGLVRIDP
jgi:Tfp pilus assembly protein FimT